MVACSKDKSMILTNLKEPITKQVLLLIGTFFFALSAIVLGHGLMQKQIAAIQDLRRNELAKVEMSYLIHIDLQKIQSLFQNMSLCKTTPELDFFSNQIKNTIKNIQNFILVIDKGGSATYSYRINFGNEEEIQRQFTYKSQGLSQASKQGKINLDVFELTSKVSDLLKHEQSFTDLIRQKINHQEGENGQEIERKILFFYKGIDPYFQRIFENSYRIYFTAQAEMLRLQDLAKTSEEKYRLQSRLALTFIGLLIIGLASMVLFNINRILRERNSFQSELTKTNENLEHTILERTWKLQEEIEERQKIEEKEHQQTEFLKTIINSLAHPFYVVDVNTYEIQMLNDYSRQLNPLDTSHCYRLTHQRVDPCGGDLHPCPIVEVKRTKKPVTMEHIHYDQNGNKIFVEVHGYPIFDADGKVIQMIEYSLDITTKKTAEIALEEVNRNLEATIHERTLNLEEEIGRRQEMQVQIQESEHYYRTLIESSNDLIVIIDATGRITYVSPSVRGMLGYSPEFLEGKILYDYLHPADIRFGIEKFGALLASLEPGQRLEHRVLAHDGSYRVLESSFRNLFVDQKINGLLLTARDITAKREADALMRKLQLVIEQSPNSVVITDKNGIIEYVNPQFELVTGHHKTEVLGQNPRILNSGITPHKTYEEMWKAISQGKVWQGEFANRKKSGEIYYENVVIAPLKNEYDEITHYVAMKENITELKKARELADASNKAKSEFLSRMSHELRTPLNAINGFSKLLLGSKAPLSPRQQEQALQINTAGHHLLNLINEILDLSRIESGRLTLSLDTILPMDGLASCLSLVESLAYNNQITLHVDDSVHKMPPLKADLTRFKQVILNLLTNAIKYNKTGGSVTITASEVDSMVDIKVTDTGIGIPVEKQQDIFVPFARLGQDNTTIEGTGIGMTITKQLVELMHGTVGFESAVGQGSTFWVKLPVAEFTESSSPGLAKTGDGSDLSFSPESTAATLLYIDDNAGDIARMREIITQLPQFTLVVRKTAEKGIQAVVMLKPDIILLALDLPEMSGIDAFIALRDNEKTKAIPAIALSSIALPETTSRCHELGFYDCLAKPVDPKILQSVLTSALNTNKETP